MKKLGTIVGLIAGLLILAVAVLWVIANPNRHRDFIQAHLENQLGRKVTLGEMSLGLVPLRFEVKDPVIAEDSSLGQQTPFIKAENLNIQVRLLPLLRGNIQVDSLELRRPGVELIRTKQGAWNFATLGSGSTAPADTTPAAPSTEREFSLEQLRIVDGQIGVTDLQQSQPRVGYDHIDLTLLHFSKGKPFAFDLAAHVEGDATQELRLKGEGGPVSASSPADTPFHGTLSLNKVNVESLMKFLNTGIITKAKGLLSGQSEMANQAGTITTNGQLKLEGAQLNNLDIGYPITFDYKLSAKIADGLISAEDATLHLGQTPLTLTGSLDTSGKTPRMDINIKSGDVSITEIARLASAFGVAFAPGTSVSGRVRADVHARGPASKPELNGTITGSELQVSGQGIPQPVQIKSVDLKLTPTAIRSNEFTASSGKTSVLGQFSLLQYASPSPSVDLALRSPGATLPEIQSLASAYGITGLNQISGQGNLNFDLKAKGSLQSLTTASAIKALNGAINLDFSPLKIAGFDTAHELAKLGGFASQLTEQNQTDVLRMIGRINVKDGIAQTDGLRAELGLGNLAASGSADLVAENLAMKVSAVFSKAFTEKISASRGGGVLNVAFTNAAGELVLPALVSGSFQKPKFSPDLKAVAELQKQKYLPSLNNPAAAVGNILDALKGKPKTDAEPLAGEKPAEKPNPVKGILDLLGGQKKEQQP